MPQAIRSAIRQVEAENGAAKISGAGALSGASAGALLAYPAPGEASGLGALEEHEELVFELGVQGLELELNVELASA